MKTRILRALCALLLAAGACALAVQAYADQTHGAYLRGYPDGTIRPEAAVTREALACVLLRLAEADVPEKTMCVFADVARTRWSYEAVGSLAGLGLLPFGTDGWFCPEQAVTWRELCGVLDTIVQSETGRALFPALSYAWSTKPVKDADPGADADTPVTRAELARAINSLLGRQPCADDAQLLAANRYTDNTPGAWYFAELIEASVPHTFRFTAGGEAWTAVG